MGANYIQRQAANIMSCVRNNTFLTIDWFTNRITSELNLQSVRIEGWILIGSDDAYSSVVAELKASMVTVQFAIEILGEVKTRSRIDSKKIKAAIKDLKQACLSAKVRVDMAMHKAVADLAREEAR